MIYHQPAIMRPLTIYESRLCNSQFVSFCLNISYTDNTLVTSLSPNPTIPRKSSRDASFSMKPFYSRQNFSFPCTLLTLLTSLFFTHLMLLLIVSIVLALALDSDHEGRDNIFAHRLLGAVS